MKYKYLEDKSDGIVYEILDGPLMDSDDMVFYVVVEKGDTFILHLYLHNGNEIHIVKDESQICKCSSKTNLKGGN